MPFGKSIRCQVGDPIFTKHFRYQKWRNPHLYKLFGYGLCKGKPAPKIAWNEVQYLHFRYLKKYLLISPQKTGRCVSVFPLWFDQLFHVPESLKTIVWDAFYTRCHAAVLVANEGLPGWDPKPKYHIILVVFLKILGVATRILNIYIGKMVVPFGMENPSAINPVNTPYIYHVSIYGVYPLPFNWFQQAV